MSAKPYVRLPYEVTMVEADEQFAPPGRLLGICHIGKEVSFTIDDYSETNKVVSREAVATIAVHQDALVAALRALRVL